MKKVALVIAAALLQGAAWAGDSDTLATVQHPWSLSQSFWESTSSQKSWVRSDLEKAPVSDFRNRLTAIIPGVDVIEKNGGLDRNSSTYLGSSSINSSAEYIVSRGFSELACIVDDVPVAFDQLRLEPNQIESVTFLSDAAAKALFGPIASSGAIYIKTKRGSYETPMHISANFESGISMAGVWPEWVSGEEYATLNNMARRNSGYPELYSSSDIAGFAKGDAMSLTTPSVDYKSLMYRTLKPVTTFGTDISGGSRILKYNFSLDALNDNGLNKVGSVNDYNKINLSSSITARIGRYIEAQAGFVGMLAFYRDGNNSFADYYTTPANAFPLSMGVSSGESAAEAGMNGYTIYSVSKAWTTNPYAVMVDGGYYTTRHRSGMFNVKVDVDMSWLLKGLKSTTYANLNTYFNQKIGKTNDYLAYYWDSTDGKGEISTHTGTRASGNSVMSNFTYQSLNFYENLSHEFSSNGHSLHSGVTFYLSDESNSSNSYYERMMNLIGQASYSYRGKYLADLVLDWSGTSRFDKGNRFAFFPALALAWVPTEEDFLKDNNVLNRLKIRAQAGLLGDSDVFGTNYLYKSSYVATTGISFGQYAYNTWFGVTNTRSSVATLQTRLANPDLTWAKQVELEAGFDAELLHCLDLGFTFYDIRQLGIITEVSGSYPLYTGSGLAISGTQLLALYMNYDSTDRVGAELSMRWHRSLGDFRTSVGAWGAWHHNIYRKVSGDTYAYDWQRITGTNTDAIRGYTCLGKFTSEEEIRSSATYGSDTEVGDLKYEDLNGDGVIDDNDISVIGHSSPRLRYGLVLDFGWKNLDLHVTGSGHAFYQIACTGTYFWNGWGDSNYSAFVRDNIGGDYPRLSYTQAAGNFKTSNFWLRNGDYFKIQNVELSYSFPRPQRAKVKGIKVSLCGSNLLTLTSFKYLDPEATSSGVTAYPLMRTVTAGVKLDF